MEVRIKSNEVMCVIKSEGEEKKVLQSYLKIFNTYIKELKFMAIRISDMNDMDDIFMALRIADMNDMDDILMDKNFPEFFLLVICNYIDTVTCFEKKLQALSELEIEGSQKFIKIYSETVTNEKKI